MATTTKSPSFDSSTDPVPPIVRQVLGFFRDQLESVQFPDVSRASLEEAATRHRERAAEADRLRALAEEAREALLESERALIQYAERAVAYARIYASNDEPLRQALEAISAASAPPTVARRRGRKRADKPRPPQLPLQSGEVHDNSPTAAPAS